nr:hypothetical protein [Tanacetum cinerariifolium]
AEHRVHHFLGLARALASGTGFKLSAVFGARAAARRAGHIALHLDFLLHPVGDFLQIKLELDAQVGAFLHAAATALATSEEAFEA